MQKSNLSRPSMHSKAPSIRFETNFADDAHSPPQPLSEPLEETTTGSKKEVSKPEGPKLDMIVLGMPEATFETEKLVTRIPKMRLSPMTDPCGGLDCRKSCHDT